MCFCRPQHSLIVITLHRSSMQPSWLAAASCLALATLSSAAAPAPVGAPAPATVHAAGSEALVRAYRITGTLVLATLDFTYILKHTSFMNCYCSPKFHILSHTVTFAIAY